MINAHEALARLREGNRRFADEAAGSAASIHPDRRRELVGGQAPFAVVLGCSDSRVPAEIVFDQGLGDLFVIRVAGNVVAPSQVASVEFAVELIGARLVVVLGHTGCGAVTATLDALEGPVASRSLHLPSIVSRIRPAVESVREAAPGADRAALLEAAIRANIRAASDHVRHGSPVLEELQRDDGLLVVGAEYSLETGLVDFFDGAPD